MSKPVLLSGGNGKVKELVGTTNGQFLVNNGSNDVVFSTATAPTVGQVPVWSGSAWAPGATGVTSLTGTIDQVSVSYPTGEITLSLPQSIASTSSPTFHGLTVGSLTGLVRATAGVLSGGAPVSLLTEVTGTLLPPNGGTGLTSSGSSGNLLLSDGSSFQSETMSGDATLSSLGVLTLKNTGSAGTYGSASAVPVLVTDAKGRVTSVTNTSIAISASAITSGVLPIARGGTGVSSLPTGGVILVGTSGGIGQLAGAAVGDIPSWTASGWVPIPRLAVANGGTNLASYAVGDLLFATGTTILARRAIGAAGTVLTSVAGVPQWSAPATGGTVTSVSSSTTLSGLTLSTTNGTTTPAIALAGTLGVGSGGTGAATLTGYVKGAGTATMTASATIPVADVTGAAPLDSPTFTGTVTIPSGASISGFAPLASPTFSGTPSLPTGTTGVTQTPGNNTTALATTAFVTAAVAASAGIPYDLPAEIPNTPATSTKVVNFKAVRAFNLAATGHQGGQLTNPSGNFVCTVAKNGTSIGTITFAAGGFSHSVTATSFAAGDVLSVETPAAALGIDTPFFTLFMTLA